MTSKTNYCVQRTRIIRTIQALTPGFGIAFDESVMPDWIKFRIEDQTTGTIRVLSSPERASLVAQWTDQKLCSYLKHLMVVWLGLSRRKQHSRSKRSQRRTMNFDLA